MHFGKNRQRFEENQKLRPSNDEKKNAFLKPLDMFSEFQILEDKLLMQKYSFETPDPLLLFNQPPFVHAPSVPGLVTSSEHTLELQTENSLTLQGKAGK